MKHPHAGFILWFDQLSIEDVSVVGGKNASLGEMVSQLSSKGINVPHGFATTTAAYQLFLKENQLERPLQKLFIDLERKKRSCTEVASAARTLLRKACLPKTLSQALIESYHELGKQYRSQEVDVAVRSSATAEDLPGASFAGQHQSFLNISGERALLEACHQCYISLFTDRAVAYREEKGFDHLKIALSIGIQKMVRADLASSGVMFTLDTESGFPNVVEISAIWGLGEPIVQGMVTPDEYLVFKPLLHQVELKPIIEKRLGPKEKKMVYTPRKQQPTRTIATTPKEQSRWVLTDDEILKLAKWAHLIEVHYGKPMDIEWAKDGRTQQLFIVQARPETIYSQNSNELYKQYLLKESGKKILEGLAIGEQIASGPVQVITDAKDIRHFKSGSILVTHTTDPDWVPVMKKAKGIITDQGGRTSHAAIVSRELGIPAIVGTTHATQLLKNKQQVTLSCAEGEVGAIYQGNIPFDVNTLTLDDLPPQTHTKLLLNMADPESAFRWWRLPSMGVGLARMEFIISNHIKVHPMALAHFSRLKNVSAKRTIEQLTKGYAPKTDYFVERLARGIAKIAAVHYPNPVIVRMSDFKTNEYANLIGGREFEPHEENPMLGFRGAARYYNPKYQDGFALECQAIRFVRETIGLDNVLIMIPFCRTLEEADRVLAECTQNGLNRGQKGLEIYVMCEIPSNVILADEFAKRFDGFSIGSNDLTQLILGIDRDSTELSDLFDERNEAVKTMIQEVIRHVHANGKKIGICGQAPSDYPEFCEFLLNAKIDSISLTPDRFIPVLQHISALEKTEIKNDELFNTSELTSFD